VAIKMKNIQLYRFDELSENAKKIALAEIKNNTDNDNDRTYIFEEEVDYFLVEKFNQKSLNVQFDASCCQDDGANIYGEFDLLAQKEIKIPDILVDWCKKYNRDLFINLPYNNRYSYNMINGIDIYDFNIADEINDETDKEIIRAANLLIIQIKNYFNDLCQEIYENAYEFFIDIDENEIIDYIENNYNSAELFFSSGNFCDEECI
jgi:hypothetical protein